MARVTYGVPVTELIGSIAGVTFQRNSSGTIARSRPRWPVNPSSLQATQQALMARLVSYWPTLSSAYKGYWNALAAAHNHFTPWGAEKTLNGYQWFLSCNLNLLVTEQALIDTPEAYSLPLTPDDFVLTADTSHFHINFDPAYTPGSNYLAIYASPPIRQASIKLRRACYLIDIVTVSAVTIIDILAAYIATFNIIWAGFYASANCTIIVRLKEISDDGGYASPYSSALIKIG